MGEASTTMMASSPALPVWAWPPERRNAQPVGQSDGAAENGGDFPTKKVLEEESHEQQGGPLSSAEEYQQRLLRKRLQAVAAKGKADAVDKGILLSRARKQKVQAAADEELARAHVRSPRSPGVLLLRRRRIRRLREKERKENGKTRGAARAPDTFYALEAQDGSPNAVGLAHGEDAGVLSTTPKPTPCSATIAQAVRRRRFSRQDSFYRASFQEGSKAYGCGVDHDADRLRRKGKPHAVFGRAVRSTPADMRDYRMDERGLSSRTTPHGLTHAFATKTQDKRTRAAVFGKAPRL